MKKILFIHLFVLASIYSVNAQETININEASHIHYEEIDNSKKDEFKFNEAKRFRKIVLNENIQSKKQIHIEDTIKLDLFNNKQYKACVDKVDIDLNGSLLVRAKLVGYENAYCFVSTSSGKSFLTIEVPENNELYMSKYIDSTTTYYLLQMDKSKMVELEGSSQEEGSLEGNPATSNINENEAISKEFIIVQCPTILETIILMVVSSPANAVAAWDACQ